MRLNKSENYAKTPLKRNNVGKNKAKQRKKYKCKTGRKYRKMNDIIQWKKRG
jgi:hypothetical protein